MKYQSINPKRVQQIEQRSISFNHVPKHKAQDVLSLPKPKIDTSVYNKSDEEKQLLKKLKNEWKHNIENAKN